MAVGVGFRDHFIADHIEHGAACKGQGKGENGLGYRYGKVTQEGAENFNHARAQGQQERPPGRNTCQQQRGNNDHPLRYVLQRNAYGNGQCGSMVAGTKSYAGGNAFGEIVDSDGHHKEHNFRNVAVRVGLRFHAGQLMQVRSETVQQMQASCTEKNAQHGNPYVSPFQRWGNQSGKTGCQHDTGGKAKQCIIVAVGNIFNQKT